MFGDKIDITKEIEKAYRAWKKGGGNLSIIEYAKKYHPQARIENEIILNCVLVPRDVLDKEEDTFCSDMGEDFEYNVEKYISVFNSRIKPLLVCFSKDIRASILISNPNERPYFTKEQCELVSGEPNKPGDQDTYEQLMTMEDKEIKFWTKYDMVPPFLEECGMGKWEDIVADYEYRMKKEEEDGIAAEKEEFNRILDSLTIDEIDAIIDEGELPQYLLRIVDIDVNSTNFISKTHEGAVIGNLDDILDRKSAIEYGVTD
jgi:hypothetical protein